MERTRKLSEPTQEVLLQLVEALSATAPFPSPSPVSAPKAGSAKGLVTIGPDFDEPLDDFKPYME